MIDYIQITERCNMTCEHCCFACTAKGEDMTLEVFKAALYHSSGYIIIGGGEPTLHPLFWKFLIEAIAYEYSEYVWLATNGSQTATALKLARLAKKGIIGCALSQDQWHDYIDPKVIAAFTKPKSNRSWNDYHSDTTDQREIRDVTQNVQAGGRALKNELYTNKIGDGCGCSGGLVKPNGNIHICGCPDSPVIGSVLTETLDLPDYLSEYECWKQIPKEEMAA